MIKGLNEKLLEKRSRLLQEGEPGKGSVVYWMSRDQRLRDNWALIFAQQRALKEKKELRVVFCLTTDYPGANLRHYLFMLKGLQEQFAESSRYNIGFRLLEGDPALRLPQFLDQVGAGMLVTDFDPLRIKREWKKQICQAVSIPFYEVDAHNIIPAWLASPKKEFAAHTLRPKIHNLLPEFLVDFPRLRKHPYGNVESAKPFDIDRLVEPVRDKSVVEVTWCEPGERAGLGVLQSFVGDGLSRYSKDRNNPCVDGQSNLSPYLHFGHIAPQRAALEVSGADMSESEKTAFLEELVVRRELADNFCHYEPEYDRFEGFHPWAQKTLDEHRRDKRKYLYSQEEFDGAETHDPLWNACQQDLMGRGKLHGYLRMYWAKKILEWSDSPEVALDIAIYLNDRYSLDGRDPNGYTGIAWSIGGVHDRAWGEREIFGKIRFMSYGGCARKFDVQGYIQNVTGRE